MYSEQGLLPLIGPSGEHVCHSLTVVSYCKPGSAHDHAALAILSHKSLAGIDLHGDGSLDSSLALSNSVLQYKFQSSSLRTACIKSLLTLTELLLFWPDTVE